ETCHRNQVRHRSVESGKARAIALVPAPVRIGVVKVTTNTDSLDCMAATGSCRVAAGRTARMAHHAFDPAFKISRCSAVAKGEPAVAMRVPFAASVII